MSEEFLDIPQFLRDDVKSRREAFEWLERYARSHYKHSAHAQTILCMLGESLTPAAQRTRHDQAAAP